MPTRGVYYLERINATMVIVAEKYGHVIGVDTHARTHTLTRVDTRTGLIHGPQTFPTSEPGLKRALGWITRGTTDGPVLVAMEGVRSYGATFTQVLTGAGIVVTEVAPPGRALRARKGKSDPIDSLAAAQSVLALEVVSLLQPRSAAGIRASLATLLGARRRVDTYRTVQRNALTALVRTTNLGIDARRALSDRQITQIASWRTRPSDDQTRTIARAEAIYLAKSVRVLKTDLQDNAAQLAVLVDDLTPGLLDEPGYGPITCATILVAYSHHGRFTSEAQFASQAGVAPIPASSGNVTRHRLNRFGDRHLNQAFDTIARTRMRFHEPTQEYVEGQYEAQKNYREIKRKLKRYLARSTYRKLEKYEIPA